MYRRRERYPHPDTPYPLQGYPPIRPLKNGSKIVTMFQCFICEKEVEFEYTMGSTIIVLCSDKCRQIWKELHK